MVLYHLPYIGIKTKPFSTVQSFVSLILKPMLSRIIITIKSLKVAPSTPPPIAVRDAVVVRSPADAG